MVQRFRIGVWFRDFESEYGSEISNRNMVQRFTNGGGRHNGFGLWWVTWGLGFERTGETCLTLSSSESAESMMS